MNVQQTDSQLDATQVELEILAERLGMDLVAVPLERLGALRHLGLELQAVIELPDRWPVFVYRRAG